MTGKPTTHEFYGYEHPKDGQCKYCGVHQLDLPPDFCKAGAAEAPPPEKARECNCTSADHEVGCTKAWCCRFCGSAIDEKHAVLCPSTSKPSTAKEREVLEQATRTFSKPPAPTPPGGWTAAKERLEAFVDEDDGELENVRPAGYKPRMNAQTPSVEEDFAQVRLSLNTDNHVEWLVADTALTRIQSEVGRLREVNEHELERLTQACDERDEAERQRDEYEKALLWIKVSGHDCVGAVGTGGCPGHVADRALSARKVVGDG